MNCAARRSRAGAEIELLGSADVRRVAAELGDIVSKHPGLGKAYSALDRLAYVPPLGRGGPDRQDLLA